MKLSGAMLNIKKRNLFLVQQARPVGLPAEWYCHIISVFGRDLWTLPSCRPLLRRGVYTGSSEDGYIHVVKRLTMLY